MSQNLVDERLTNKTQTAPNSREQISTHVSVDLDKKADDIQHKRKEIRCCLVIICSVIAIFFIVATLFAFAYNNSRHQNENTHFNIECVIPTKLYYTEPCLYHKPAVYNVNWLSFWLCHELQDINIDRSKNATFFNEFIELDLSEKRNSYALRTPYRRETVYHDFNNLETVILNNADNYCLVMPLNSDMLRPPDEFFNHIQYFGRCGFKINNTVVMQQLLIAPMPKSENIIASEVILERCEGKSIYLLEKVHINESLANNKYINYVQYAGNGILEYHVYNITDSDGIQISYDTH